MSSTSVPVPDAEHWRVAVERLLAVGALASGAWELDPRTVIDDDARLHEFDSAVVEYRCATDDVLSSRAGPGQQSMALLGGLEVVDALLSISEPAQHAEVRSGAVGVDLFAWNAALAVHVEEMTGRSWASVAVPATLDTKLSALERTGAEELAALARNDTVWLSLMRFGSGDDVFGGMVVERAFEAVAGALEPFQQRVMTLLQWIIERLRGLMPDDFRQLLDAKLVWVKEALQRQAPERVGEVIGQLLGRDRAELAWRTALESGRSPTTAGPVLDAAVAEHLVLIEHIGNGHRSVQSIAERLTGWVAPGVPQVKIVVGATAMIQLALVMFQVFESFEHVEKLARGGPRLSLVGD